MVQAEDLVGARAALSASGETVVSHGGEDLHEAGLQDGGGSGGRGIGRGNGGLSVSGRAGAALGLLASRLLALELTLGLGAVSGLHALVGTLELLADGRALGFGGGTGGVALSGLADVLALGAVILLAGLLGATDGTGGLGTMDGALGARSLCRGGEEGRNGVKALVLV